MKKELASVGQEMQELSPIAFLDDSDDDFCDTSFINGIINDLNVESPTMKQAPSTLSQGHQDLEQPIHKQQDLKQPSPKQSELVQPFSEQSDLDKPVSVMPTVEQAPLPHAKEQPFPKQHDLEKPPAKQQDLAQPLPMQPDPEQPSPQQLDLEQQIPMQPDLLKPGPVSDPCDDQTVMNDHTGNGDDKQTVDGLPLSEDSTKYRVGDFLLSNCGIKACPCLVVQTPDDMEGLPHAGVWVQYLKKARASLWTLEEKPFFLEYRNICKSLEPPSLTAAGTMIYYKLKL